MFKKICIIGTGAIGGYYGARLAAAGNEVHFLFHSDYEHVKTHGLKVESVRGDIELKKVNAYKSAAEMPKCDLVIVGLKAVKNDILKTILPLVTADDGQVLTLQNGLGADDEIAKIVGADRVLGGLCFICSNKVGPGFIKHLDYGKITLGEYATDFGAKGITPRLKALSDLLTEAGIENEVLGDLLLGRWRKLMWNIPYNGMSVVLNATTAEMVADKTLRPLFRSLMAEVQKGAAAFGREIPDAFAEAMIEMTDKMTPYMTSMMLDYRAGREMEVEAICGEPLRLAASRGVHLPYLDMLYRELTHLNLSRKSL
ncbi:MAG: putative 2-dehydropantoate 2-reductase [Kiritimatiellae bacterium]|nr:putative 2-dehydropantoate 2-reductase [Kiritimatiellia bacterium]